MSANTDIYGGSAWALPQERPTDSNCEPFRATAFTSAGCQIVMGDAVVKTVSASMNQNSWIAGLRPNDGANMNE